MMMGCALAMFFILTSSMVVQLTSMSPYAAPLSLLLSPPVPQVARKNLLQQLSVQWSNNAKMILRYWALQGSDDDDNPLFP